MEKIKELAKKFLTRDIILYVIFGVLTTLVNIGSFYIMTSILKWNEDLSNFIAIALAILFAYFTNKDWVFHSKAKGFKEKFSEFLKFVAGRAVTMVIEFGGCFILFRTYIVSNQNRPCVSAFISSIGQKLMSRRIYRYIRRYKAVIANTNLRHIQYR